MDLSFISLTKILEPVIPLLTPGADIVALIKPQFEVGKGEVGKGGIVKSAEKHQQVISDITEYVQQLGILMQGVIESPIKGAKGNTEFLLHGMLPTQWKLFLAAKDAKEREVKKLRG